MIHFELRRGLSLAGDDNAFCGSIFFSNKVWHVLHMSSLLRRSDYRYSTAQATLAFSMLYFESLNMTYLHLADVCSQQHVHVYNAWVETDNLFVYSASSDLGVNYLFVNDRLMRVALYTLMAPCLGNFVCLNTPSGLSNKTLEPKTVCTEL